VCVEGANGASAVFSLSYRHLGSIGYPRNVTEGPPLNEKESAENGGKNLKQSRDPNAPFVESSA